MEVSQILYKLEPLMPEQVERWLRTLDTAQPEVKALVERQIRYTAHKFLGDFRNKILLSLPTETKAKGMFHLGTLLYEKAKWPVGISKNELMQNLAIFGRSGAGKTNVAFHLLEQLAAKRIPFLFLDWKRTARHLIPVLGRKLKVYTPGKSLSPFPFNPFIVPPGLERGVYVNHVVDLLASAYTLGDGAKSILQKALLSCYRKKTAPAVSEVSAAIEKMPTRERATGWKISATRAIESLELSKTQSTDEAAQEKLAQSLLKQNTVIELDGLSSNSKKFLIPLLCFWIYSVLLSSQKREQLKFVIFLEEAHHALYRQEHRAKESLMNVLLRQCRELGVSFVVIDQHPHLISSAALGNCYTTICLNLKDPTDFNKAAGLSLVEDSEKRFFSMLPVGQGIVKLQDRWRRPFLVQFPLMNVKKGFVTDALLGQLLKDKISVEKLRERGDGRFVGAGRFRFGESGLEEGAVVLLNDVLRFVNDGVDRRYKRLGVSVDRGNRWKLQLIDQGLVVPDKMKVGRTVRLVLRPTENARRLLLDKEGSDPRASLVHEYWKRFYADQFSDAGYQVTLETPRKTGKGNMDVLATRASESIAIEVETGKSDVVSNVKRDLLEGVQKVIVIATDEGARQKVERQLAKEGLILPERVEVVLRDEFQVIA